MSVNVKDLRRNDAVVFRNGKTHVVSRVKQLSDYEYDVYFKDDQDFCYDSEGKCKIVNCTEWFDIMKVVHVIDSFGKCELFNQSWINALEQLTEKTGEIKYKKGLSIMKKTIISIIGIIFLIVGTYMLILILGG